MTPPATVAFFTRLPIAVRDAVDDELRRLQRNGRRSLRLSALVAELLERGIRGNTDDDNAAAEASEQLAATATTRKHAGAPPRPRNRKRPR